MAHTIDIRKSSRSRAIPRRRLERLTRRTLRTVLDGEGLNGAELGAWFVDDPAIAALNRVHRRVDRSTDVLAFPLAETDELHNPGVHLGDLVISLPTARRQAHDLGHPLEVELALLLIHGALHLLGHTHEDARDTRRMRRKEQAYLAALGFPGVNSETP